MSLLIFKTNLQEKKHVRKLYRIFRGLQDILKWNVDLEDIDKILRVETVNVSPRMVETALQQAGYYCEEL